MFKLKKNSENLLDSKYGFQKMQSSDNARTWYRYGKGLTIYSTNHPKYSGLVYSNGLSRKTQDIIYTLIKDDVLTLVPNENKTERIERMQAKIDELQRKIKELEEK